MSDHRDNTRSALLIEALAPVRRTRVVDVGANPINETPYDGLLEIGACDVWGFEPQKDAFEALQARDAKNERYFNAAVGAGGPATLNLCATSGTTSLLKPNTDFLDFLGDWHGYFRVVGTETLDTTPLDDFASIPDFDLLKIDVQGSEVDVFRSGQQKLSRALAVITEVAAVPIYHDQPLLDQQMATLQGFGYSLHKFLFFKAFQVNSAYGDRLHLGRMRSQLIDGDAVFIRNLLALGDMESEALKHLAILADAVFESFDLVFYCLSFLRERGELDDTMVERYIGLLPAAFRKQPPARAAAETGEI